MRGTTMLASALLTLAAPQILGACEPQTSPDPRFASAVFAPDFGGDSTSPVTIPDAAPAGVLLGPLQAGNDTGTIHDVSLKLDISHPCTGDVAAWLYYDADNDGVYDAETPIEFYLARSGLSVSPAWSCSTELEGSYYFRHEETVGHLVGWDTDSFESFRGLPGGGRFYVRVADNVEGDMGTIRGWDVQVK